MTLTDGIGIDVNEGVAQITYDFDTNRRYGGYHTRVVEQPRCWRQ